jgi:hypothetical protein
MIVMEKSNLQEKRDGFNSWDILIYLALRHKVPKNYEHKRGRCDIFRNPSFKSLLSWHMFSQVNLM